MDAKEIFKALDNDIRLKIMGWLKDPEREFADQIARMPDPESFEGGVCVGAVSEKAGVSQSTASHYLDILQRAGLVESYRLGKWTLYRRNERTVRELSDYIVGEL